MLCVFYMFVCASSESELHWKKGEDICVSKSETQTSKTNIEIICKNKWERKQVNINEEGEEEKCTQFLFVHI